MEKFIISSLKIFFWITLGAIIKSFIATSKTLVLKKIIQHSTNLIVFVIVPFFVAINIWRFGLNKELSLFILIVFCSIMFISYFISRYITKNYEFSFQEVFFPLTFMNTLYLGIPVTQYFVSLKATYYTIIYSIIVTIIQFSVGVSILRRKVVIDSINFLSTILVFLLAFLLNYFQIEIPSFLLIIHSSISYFLSPLMLCFIGYSIRWDNLIQNIRLHIFTNIIKIIVVFITSTIILSFINNFLPLDHEFIKSVVLTSILPSAIINYIILEKFNIDSNFTVGEIFWGTIVTLFLLPYLSEVLDIVLLILK